MADISIAEAKIYILYLVRAVPGISFRMLEENSADSLYMNYFSFNQAYDELTAGNLIDRHFERGGVTDALGGTETLTITSGGSAILDDLVSSIRAPFLEYLETTSAKLQELMNVKSSVTSEMRPTEDGKFTVTLFSDKEGKSFKVSFNCDSEESARRACESWNNNEENAIAAFLSELKS